jgi:hypothetical protein
LAYLQANALLTMHFLLICTITHVGLFVACMVKDPTIEGFYQVRKTGEDCVVISKTIYVPRHSMQTLESPSFGV